MTSPVETTKALTSLVETKQSREDPVEDLRQDEEQGRNSDAFEALGPAGIAAIARVRLPGRA